MENPYPHWNYALHWYLFQDCINFELFQGFSTWVQTVAPWRKSVCFILWDQLISCPVAFCRLHVWLPKRRWQVLLGKCFSILWKRNFSRISLGCASGSDLRSDGSVLWLRLWWREAMSWEGAEGQSSAVHAVQRPGPHLLDLLRCHRSGHYAQPDWSCRHLGSLLRPCQSLCWYQQWLPLQSLPVFILYWVAVPLLMCDFLASRFANIFLIPFGPCSLQHTGLNEWVTEASVVVQAWLESLFEHYLKPCWFACRLCHPGEAYSRLVVSFKTWNLLVHWDFDTLP